MSAQRTIPEKITLGSGDLMIRQYSDTIPAYTEFKVESDLLGRIQGGATIEYTGEWYEAKDDTGKAVKTIITNEDAVFKTGIVTFNAETLDMLCSTGRVTDGEGIRTIKIGGIGNYNGKSYAICFHHTDPVDGDVWLLVRGVNQAGFSLAFAKDKETVIDAEFKCLPQDDEGTLIQYIEDTSKGR